MLVHEQKKKTIEQNRKSRNRHPVTSENFVCDRGDISNHWVKDGLFK